MRFCPLKMPLTGDHFRKSLVLPLIVFTGLCFYYWSPRTPSGPVKDMCILSASRGDGHLVLREVEQSVAARAPYVPPSRDTPYNFTGFDNVTGLEDYLVPNFVRGVAVRPYQHQQQLSSPAAVRSSAAQCGDQYRVEEHCSVMRSNIVLWDKNEYLLRRSKGEAGGEARCCCGVGGARPARRALLAALALLAAAAVVTYICGPASLHVARIAQLPQLSQLANFTSQYFLPASSASRSESPHQAFNFTGFNNETGQPRGDPIIPNFIHFLRLRQKELSFVDFVVILAAFKNQRPEHMYFHTDEVDFSGEYWQKLQQTPGFVDVVEIVPIVVPAVVFEDVAALRRSSDSLRLRILMKYGGIFLDNETYLARSLDCFRRFEMAVSWPEGGYLGTQVLLAHPDARLLREWLDLEMCRGGRGGRGSEGGEEDGEPEACEPEAWCEQIMARLERPWPTREVLRRRPELVHRVGSLFGAFNCSVADPQNGPNAGHLLPPIRLYSPEAPWLQWRDQYAIHLLSADVGKQWDVPTLMRLPTTFREMVLDVFNPDTGAARVL